MTNVVDASCRKTEITSRLTDVTRHRSTTGNWHKYPPAGRILDILESGLNQSRHVVYWTVLRLGFRPRKIEYITVVEDLKRKRHPAVLDSSCQNFPSLETLELPHCVRECRMHFNLKISSEITKFQLRISTHIVKL